MNLVEHRSAALRATILQGSSGPWPMPRARSWFRSTLPAVSTQCFHQISLPSELVRKPVIETGPSEWRSDARPSSYIRIWWVGTELNGHSISGAFTAPWALQCQPTQTDSSEGARLELTRVSPVHP